MIVCITDDKLETNKYEEINQADIKPISSFGLRVMDVNLYEKVMHARFEISQR